MHLVVPKSFNDAQDVADKFKDSIPVIINLQGSDADLSKRLIDFASGLTYALDGGMQRIADKVFLLTPRNVEVSAEERARADREGLLQPVVDSPAVQCGSASSDRGTWRARWRAAGATPCSRTDSGSGRAARAGARARRRGARLQPRAGRARRPRDPRPQAGPARRRWRARSRRRPHASSSRSSRGTTQAERARRLPGRAGLPRRAEHAGRAAPGRARLRRARRAGRRGARAARAGALRPRSAPWSSVPERLMRRRRRLLAASAPPTGRCSPRRWIDAAVRRGMPAAQAADARDGDDGRHRRAAARPRRRHARRCAARSTSPGGTTARGLAALERGGVRAALAAAMDDVVEASDARRATEIADFLSALIIVYTLIIFAWIIVSWSSRFGVRMPYSRPLNAVLDFLRDVTEPVPAHLPPARRCSSARSTSARSSRSSCCRSAAGCSWASSAPDERRAARALRDRARRGRGRRRSTRSTKAIVRGRDRRASTQMRPAPRRQARSTRATPASPSACSPAAGRCCRDRRAASRWPRCWSFFVTHIAPAARVAADRAAARRRGGQPDRPRARRRRDRLHQAPALAGVQRRRHRDHRSA